MASLSASTQGEANGENKLLYSRKIKRRCLKTEAAPLFKQLKLRIQVQEQVETQEPTLPHSDVCLPRLGV